jgi:AraC-like DNA-binding protein
MVVKTNKPLAAATTTELASGHARSERRTVTQLRDAAAGPTRHRLDQDHDRVSDWLKPVLVEIKARLFDPLLQLQTLWPVHGINDKNVASRFCAELGQLPWTYITDLRLEVGERLVRDSHLLQHQIAGILGYASADVFSDAFKKRYGLSPTNYRKAPPVAETSPVAPDGPWLAVRRDVDPRRAEELVGITVQLGLDWSCVDHAFRSHPDYAAAYWYTGWIRDRLGHAEIRTAWPTWQRANLDLRELLGWRHDRRREIVRQRPRPFQTDAFVWLLIDCFFVRLLEDAGEAEHFADLAVAASENGPPGLRALPLALKAHSIQRRGVLRKAEETFEEALEASRAPGVEPWVVGWVHELWAELLLRRGKERTARRELFIASTGFKKAGDYLERLRCAVVRFPAWFEAGIDPSRLMTFCIPALEQYPVADSILRAAHLNRLLAVIYLTDRLTGSHLVTIKRFRAEMPAPTPGFMAAQYQRLDGLLFALVKESEPALAALRDAANWFEDNDLLAEAAVCWLQFSWVALDVDVEVAEAAALAAYRHMVSTGFNSHDLQVVAKKIYHDARHGILEKSLLRRSILLAVCPKLRAQRACPTTQD